MIHFFGSPCIYLCICIFLYLIYIFVYVDNLTSGISVFLYLRQPFISSGFNYFSKNLEFVEIITKKEFRACRNNKERMQFSPPLLPLTTEEWLLRSAVENISQKVLSSPI